MGISDTTTTMSKRGSVTCVTNHPASGHLCNQPTQRIMSQGRGQLPQQPPTIRIDRFAASANILLLCLGQCLPQWWQGEGRGDSISLHKSCPESQYRWLWHVDPSVGKFRLQVAQCRIPPEPCIGPQMKKPRCSHSYPVNPDLCLECAHGTAFDYYENVVHRHPGPSAP